MSGFPPRSCRREERRVVEVGLIRSQPVKTRVRTPTVVPAEIAPDRSAGLGAGKAAEPAKRHPIVESLSELHVRQVVPDREQQRLEQRQRWPRPLAFCCAADAGELLIDPSQSTNSARSSKDECRRPASSNPKLSWPIRRRDMAHPNPSLRLSESRRASGVEKYPRTGLINGRADQTRRVRVGSVVGISSVAAAGRNASRRQEKAVGSTSRRAVLDRRRRRIFEKTPRRLDVAQMGIPHVREVRSELPLLETRQQILELADDPGLPPVQEG